VGPKTESTLSGRAIWVTRPAKQSEALCRLIEAAGGRAVPVPVIEIHPVSQTVNRSRLAALLDAADAIIFTSRNAVRHAAVSLPEFYKHIHAKLILAIGAGTRRELESQGLAGIISAGSGTGSEALLELVQMQPDNLCGKHILIVRGVGGRELLEQSLRRAGAEVNCLEVYQRNAPDLLHNTIGRLWSTDPPDAMIITSVEGLHNLVKMTAPERLPDLMRTPLVVMSERISTAASTLGFCNRKAVAEDASDAGLVQATRKIFEN
jgi:uroporphyrinogen-III synthase